jgi:DNA-binding winged helix-turn-helix (wHTH) protein/tetratricopeptide (TPR) repeat protein
MVDTDKGPFRLGDWGVHPSRLMVERDGKQVSVRPKAMDVLVRLAKRAPEVASANELIESVWAPAHVGDDAVQVAVHELRNALGDRARQPTYIETVHTKGYRVIAAVRHPQEFRPILPAGSVSGADIAAREAQDPIRVAVMPLTNLSGSSDDDYLRWTIPDIVADQLRETGRFGVVAMTTVRKAARQDLIVGELGQTLQADYIVEGSLLARDRVYRVKIDVVTAGDGTLLLGESITIRKSTIEELLDSFERIAARIAGSLSVPMARTDRRSYGPQSARSPDAYYQLSKAEVVWRQSADGEKMITIIKRAIEADPNWAYAHAYLANLYRAPTTGEPDWEGCLRELDRALTLNPEEPKAHAVRAGYLQEVEFDYPGAAHEYELARRFGATLRDIRLITDMYLNAGRYEEGLALEREFDREEPLDPETKWRMARFLWNLDCEREAQALADEALELNPDFRFYVYQLIRHHIHELKSPDIAYEFARRNGLGDDATDLIAREIKVAEGHAELSSWRGSPAADFWAGNIERHIKRFAEHVGTASEMSAGTVYTIRGTPDYWNCLEEWAGHGEGGDRKDLLAQHRKNVEFVNQKMVF